MTVSGITFVPDGPHNSYDEGGWLTPAGYSRLFRGARYRLQVPCRPWSPCGPVSPRPTLPVP